VKYRRRSLNVKRDLVRPIKRIQPHEQQRASILGPCPIRKVAPALVNPCPRPLPRPLRAIAGIIRSLKRTLVPWFRRVCAFRASGQQPHQAQAEPAAAVEAGRLRRRREGGRGAPRVQGRGGGHPRGFPGHGDLDQHFRGRSPGRYRGQGTRDRGAPRQVGRDSRQGRKVREIRSRSFLSIHPTPI
jgi:hypothetical protein